ncbi:unnamed protein product [Nippostrongylus brasiliensis]|uniref:Putative 6-phosphogluconolactonase (inferred by orthology to a C. elegans protein) n=1 Tax=Nippostrongylus brasiliensis TaxID=27835 RepID=A0A0N4Y971_NIPBR|nr:unnamed protein product [Nippostrongylus brasiliensis]
MSAYSASLPFDIKELMHPDVSALLIHKIITMERPQTIVAQTREEMCQNVKDYLLETLAHLIKYNGLISIGVSGYDRHFFNFKIYGSIYNTFSAFVLYYGFAFSASKTALLYETTLRSTLCPEQIGRLPRFDMLFLGMGPDGHTCSLFPNHRLLQKCLQNDLLTWVVAITDSPKPPSQRISLTLSVLNAAKNVAFIVTGEEKAAMVKSVVDSENLHVPASFVRPFSKKLRFFLDKDAASKL